MAEQGFPPPRTGVETPTPAFLLCFSSQEMTGRDYVPVSTGKFHFPVWLSGQRQGGVRGGGQFSQVGICSDPTLFRSLSSFLASSHQASSQSAASSLSDHGSYGVTRAGVTSGCAHTACSLCWLGLGLIVLPERVGPRGAHSSQAPSMLAGGSNTAVCADS